MTDLRRWSGSPAGIARATGRRSAAVTRAATWGLTVVHGGPARLMAAAALRSWVSSRLAAVKNPASAVLALGVRVLGDDGVVVGVVGGVLGGVIGNGVAVTVTVGAGAPD